MSRKEDVSRPKPLALILPIFLMLVGFSQTPGNWGMIWIVSPALGAFAYLGNRHLPRWGWITPVILAGWLVFSGDGHTVWAWMLLGTVSAAALFGFADRKLAESSETLWAMAPLLALVLLFPLSNLYPAAVKTATAAVTKSGEFAYQSYVTLGVEGAALSSIAESVDTATKFLNQVLESLLPAVLFFWATILVMLAVLLARRVHRAIGRPLVSVPRFTEFRMPDGAIWLLVIALASIALRQTDVLTIGVNVAISVAMGYGLQGLAVADFILMMRGLAPGIIWILFLFIALFAPPVFLSVATLLGIADVFLNLRRRHSDDGSEQQKA